MLILDLVNLGGHDLCALSWFLLCGFGAVGWHGWGGGLSQLGWVELLGEWHVLDF